MHRRQFVAGSALLPWAAVAAPAAMPVVASFSVLADMVRRIGGPLVDVTTLVPIDGDAHGYQPRPADARAVMAARVVVENGLGLDNWMGRLATAAGFKGVRVVATAGVQARPMQPGQTVTDPHAWQDPRNGVRYVQSIADGLAVAEPPLGDAVRTAATAYQTEITRMDAWIAAQFAAIPESQRRIITTHDAFGYYGARYGIDFLAAQGLSTEAEPSAKAVAALVAQIRKEKIRAVFVENMTDPRLARMLMRETGVVLGGTVYSDALSGPRGPASTYLEMLRHNTTLFAAAMRL